MPDVKFATADVSAMKLGTTNIAKVMLGTSQVWPSAAGVDVLMEDFNNFTDAPWTISGATIVAGRTGTGARCGTSAHTATYTIPSIDRSEYLTVGFAWQTSALAATTFAIELRGDAAATRHTSLTVGTTGAITVARDTIPLGASSTGLIAATTWYYLEIQMRLGDSPNGSAIVRLNGTEVINVTGVDTKNAGTATVFDSVRLLRPATGLFAIYDDLYITTGAGAAFKGDIAI